MSATDPEHIAFACPTQLLLDLADTVDGITGNPFEWDGRGCKVMLRSLPVRP